MIVRDGLVDKHRLWLDHLESCASSGLSMRAYAECHGLDVRRFYGWKKQLKMLGLLPGACQDARQSKSQTCAADQHSAPFIRAAIISSEALRQPPEPKEYVCAARIALANGITIDVPAGVAPDALSTLIGAAMHVCVDKDVSSP